MKRRGFFAALAAIVAAPKLLLGMRKPAPIVGVDLASGPDRSVVAVMRGNKVIAFGNPAPRSWMGERFVGTNPAKFSGLQIGKQGQSLAQIEHLRGDPVAFAETYLDVELTPMQKVLMRRLGKRAIRREGGWR